MISLFDTTLRDGTQGERISFSADDKLRIAQRLDEFGVRYIEGGWPGSNPRDLEFFAKARSVAFRNARLTAFGSTRRHGTGVDQDPNLQALLKAETPVVCIFGKSWLLHVRTALGIEPGQNLDLIADSVRYLSLHVDEVIYDAEHFFDGFRHDPDYALSTLRRAAEAGAGTIVLCDTNGGSLPEFVAETVARVRRALPSGLVLGIHAHNDGELAVANTLAAVRAGARHVQGTVNGYGERCGNANLCSVIPNLQLKMGFQVVPQASLAQLSSLAHFVSEVANLSHPPEMPYTGRSAFAHKGGIHVSAVIKNPATYEHVSPETVGSHRRVLVSDLSGRSNVAYKAEELGIPLEGKSEHIPAVVERLKALENEGYQYEAAEGSFELLVRHTMGDWSNVFSLKGFRMIIEKNEAGQLRSEATIRVVVDGRTEHTAAEGCGPVEALDKALRKALRLFFPEVERMQLTDYKVRVLNEKDGTGAKVRVLIDSSDGERSFGTVGLSDNIIEASWQALADSMSFYLSKHVLAVSDRGSVIRDQKSGIQSVF